MARQNSLLPLLALVLSLFAFHQVVDANGRASRSSDDDSQNGLLVRKILNVFQSDGGAIEKWDSNSQVLQDFGVAADRITLEKRGLSLPKLSDSSQLAYILEGKGQVGLVFPSDTESHVSNLRKGDIVAIPNGVSHWWYNNGDSRFVIITVTVTSSSSGYVTTYLQGPSSVLQGFDEELLSAVYDVEKDIIRQVRGSQKGTVIIKTQEDLNISPDIEPLNKIWRHNYTDSLDYHHPLAENEGGAFRIFTEKELWLLNLIDMAAGIFQLAPGAIFAPNYLYNAHAVVYVKRGKGRVQIVSNDQTVLDTEVSEGSLFVMPKLNLLMAQASEEGLEAVMFVTHSMPYESILAGSNSLYKRIPVQVLAAADNVDVEVEEQLLRSEHFIIVPSKDGITSGVTTQIRESEKVLRKGISNLLDNRDLNEFLKQVTRRT